MDRQRPFRRERPARRWRLLASVAGDGERMPASPELDPSVAAGLTGGNTVKADDATVAIDAADRGGRWNDSGTSSPARD